MSTRTRSKQPSKTAEVLKSIPWYAYVVGGTVTFFLARNVVKNWSEAAKRRKELEVWQGGVITGGVTSPGGTNSPVNLAQISAEIYDSFCNNDWLGWTEDEERAISALLQVPKPYIKDLANYYSQLYKRNLYNDFVAYLTSSDYERVRSLLT